MTKYSTSTYCVFGTGLSQTTSSPGGIRVKTLSSSSLTSGGTWEDGGTITVPSWVSTSYPDVVNVWAPEIYKDESMSVYYLDYAVSVFGTQVSAIGVASFSTPCTASSWTGHGIIVSSTAGETYSAIDPNVFLDEDDQLWLSYVSFYGGIAMVQLSSPTTAVSSTATIYNIAKRSGTTLKRPRRSCTTAVTTSCSRPETRVVRAPAARTAHALAAPPHPAVRSWTKTALRRWREAVPASLVASGDYIGPSGGDVYVEDSTWWFIFHYYDGADSGAVTTALQAISLSSAKWPRSYLTA